MSRSRPDFSTQERLPALLLISAAVRLRTELFQFPVSSFQPAQTNALRPALCRCDTAPQKGTFQSLPASLQAF